MRVGIGFDVHRMVLGKKCVIGGVQIRYSHGPLAHSDGDVLLHALVDAILGAAALGDMGKFFPDTDPEYKDADSRIFVKEALRLVTEKGYTVTSIDSVVFADAPRLSHHRESICESIAEMLSLTPECVSVKGKTFEGLGPIGQGHAIAAQVVAVLSSNE